MASGERVNKKKDGQEGAEQQTKQRQQRRERTEKNQTAAIAPNQLQQMFWNYFTFKK